VACSFEECRIIRRMADARGGEPITRATPRLRGVEPRGLLNATVLSSGAAGLMRRAAARSGAPEVGVIGERGVGGPALDPSLWRSGRPGKPRSKTEGFPCPVE
jgi:hypothetical protein